ncbi:unnamed protein product [Clonostachys rosea]|uniref:Peptidase S1 domain-containing protein n=1 Tax=Bionectria ochroleuca TaxID=29856 RepID=A0ABY6ULE5_BIOOC|nr:unnamed protein product [Clonostachys rosea]
MLRLILTATLTASAGLAAPSTAYIRQSSVVVEHELVTTVEAEQRVRDYWTLDRVASIDHDPYGAEPFPTIPEEEKSKGAPFDFEGAIPRTVGRLLYIEPFEDGWRDSSCTATILESANEATIVTAAHCLKPNPIVTNNTAWHDNVLFIPGFHPDEPQLNFTINRAFLLRGWTDGPETQDDRYRNDRAFAVLNLNTPAKRAARANLGLGQRIQFEKNATAFEMTYNLGYPRYCSDTKDELRVGTPAFTGRHLAACFGKEVDWFRFPSNMAGYPCMMGGGSSGGPHLAEFDSTTGLGTVVGVNSIGDRDSVNNGPLLELGSTVNDEPAKLLFEAAQAVNPSLT